MGNKQTVFSEEQLEDYTVRDWQRGRRETLINIPLSMVGPKRCNTAFFKKKTRHFKRLLTEIISVHFVFMR